MAFSGILSYFTDLLDVVETGVSDVAAFSQKMENVALSVFGAGNPIGSALAQINSDIQAACKALEVLPTAGVGAVPGALVLTGNMLTDIWNTVEEGVTAALGQAGLAAGATLGQKLDAGVVAVLPILINLGLSFVPGGGVLSLAAPTLEKMVALILADL